MQKAIVENGVTRYVDLTPKEEAEVTARVKAGAEAAIKEKEMADKVEVARQKVLADPALADLAVALGMKKPG